LLDKAVDELFAEYAAAYSSGQRPRVADYLARAGEDADELATMIDRLLRTAPRRAATEDDAARLASLLQEPPILELRVRRGLRRDEVVDRLLVALALSPKLRPRLQDAYHELETAQLDPAHVDSSVWRALQEILSEKVREIAVWRPVAPTVPAYYRASPEIGLETQADIRQHGRFEPDEIDRLFRGGS
jgi:hypothetical protein